MATKVLTFDQYSQKKGKARLFGANVVDFAAAVQSVFAEIKEWLEPYRKKELVEVKSLHYELLGPFGERVDSEKLLVNIGEELIYLVPQPTDMSVNSAVIHVYGKLSNALILVSIQGEKKIVLLPNSDDVKPKPKAFDKKNFLDTLVQVNEQ